MAILFVQTELGWTASQGATSNIDYGLDWSDWTVDFPDDPIVSSEWECSDQSVILTNKALAGNLTTVWFKGGKPGEWHTLENTVTTAMGRSDSRICLMYVRPSAATGSALFKSRSVALAKIRRDRLTMLAASIMPGVDVSDDYIWEKLVSAESQIGHMLRVPLVPTHYFPRQPTQEQIDALNGQPWEIDQPYDYDPADYRGDRWGMITLRNKPVQAVHDAKLVYPAPTHVVLNVPNDWLRLNRKFGHLQLVPTSSPFLSPIGGLVMSHMSAGRMLPFAMEIEYTAGLQDVTTNYPELVDLVQKLAVTKIVEDGFMPSSGSISADGLSQSLSVDVGKYHEDIERMINGESGANGGLMARLHGIRVMVA